MKNISNFTSRTVFTTIFSLYCSSAALLGHASSSVIVKLANNPHSFTATSVLTSAQQQTIRENQLNAKLLENNIKTDYVYSSTFYGFSAQLDDQQLLALKSDPDVVAIFPNTYYTLSTKNTFNEGESYEDFIDEREKDKDDRHPLIEFPQMTPTGPLDSAAHELSLKGAGQHIYVLDSGVDVKHKDLIDRLGTSFASSPCEHELGKEVCVTPYSDDNSHGTHVAGTALATDNKIDILGMAPQATLHAIKVCPASGNCELDAILAGLDWAVKDMNTHGKAAVLNVSLGGLNTSDPGSCSANGYKGNNPEAEAYCNAAHQGMVIVAAAGNDSEDSAMHAPAKFNSTITVSSYKRLFRSSAGQTVEFSDFSNWGVGPNEWSYFNSGVITIAAPGENITSLNRTHGNLEMSGTSMAAPTVAGAAALILERFAPSKDFNAFLNVRKALVSNALVPDRVFNAGFPHNEGLLNLHFLKKASP